jgi:hypothetical protein
MANGRQGIDGISHLPMWPDAIIILRLVGGKEV